MKLKALIVAVLLLLSPSMSCAVEYGTYDLKQIFDFGDSNAPTERNKVFIDVVYLNRVIDDPILHAGSYPPKFDSAGDKGRAVQDVIWLMRIMDTLTVNENRPPEFLLQAATLASIAHNLDIPDSWDKASSLFKRLMKANPDHPLGNYRYGLFLVDSGNSSESIPYLEKALSAGIDGAAYTLGFSYFALGNKTKAIECFEMYRAKRPDNQEALNLIEALRKENILAKSEYIAFASEPPNQPVKITSMADLGELMETYYLKPKPEIVKDAILLIDKEKLFERKALPYALWGFFIIVFQKNPDLIPAWRETIRSTSPITKDRLLLTMLIAIDEDPIGKTAERSPAGNDMYWGAFYATGDDKYLGKLVDQLQYYDERKDQTLFVTGATAKWSLASNARRHLKVQTFLKKIVENPDGRTREIVKDLLDGGPGKARSEWSDVVKSQHAKGVW